jgi:hypothetical protein
MSLRGMVALVDMRDGKNVTVTFILGIVKTCFIDNWWDPG